jgi:hypothetical protein
MRLITPITDDEVLIARGAYTYFLNDQPTGVTEPWSIHWKDGFNVTRVEREARARYGTTLLLEAVSESLPHDEKFYRFEVQAFNERNPSVAAVRAIYQFRERRLTVERTINGGAVQIEEAPLPAYTVISPLMRVFLGRTILEIAERGAGKPVSVITPYLNDPNNADLLLRPTFDRRSAQLLEHQKLTLAGRNLSTRVFRYLGNQQDDHSLFWVDSYGFLVRHLILQSDGRVWDTVLTDYEATQ